jgi:lysophospholipase L1-like esterase
MNKADLISLAILSLARFVREGWQGCAMVVAAAGLMVMPTAVRAGPPRYLSFDQTPVVATQSPELFRRLLERGSRRGVHGLLLGDSQETSPEGFGAVYVPALNARFAQQFGGKVPATSWQEMLSSTSFDNPYGEWLVSSKFIPQGPRWSGISFSKVPPGLRSSRNTGLGAGSINGPQLFGQIFVLEPDNVSGAPSVPSFPGGVNIYGPATGDPDSERSMYVDVLVSPQPNSGGVSFRGRFTESPAPSFSQVIDIQFVAPDELFESSEPVGTKFVRYRFGPMQVPPGRYLQVEVAGTSQTKLTEIVSVRFVPADESKNHGILLTDIARGGYRSDSILELNPECGPLLAALEPDFAMLTYGANDVANSATPEVYRQGLVSLIAMLRAQIDPNLPIILVADPANAGARPDLNELQDQYAGVCYDISLSDPRVLALNSRRLLEQRGWTYSGFRPFAPDRVHYSPLGANLKAQLEVDTLFGVFADQRGMPCLADIGGQGGTTLPDGVLDNNDFAAFVVLFFDGSKLLADLGAQGGVIAPDGRLDNNDFAAFISLFFAGCSPDVPPGPLP